MSHHDVIEHFLKDLSASEKSPATILNYQLDLEKFAEWFVQTTQDQFEVKLITATDLRQYKEYLINFPYQPKTINRRIGSLRSFISWLVEMGEIKTRFPLPKLVKENRRSPKWLDKNQQHALMRHLQRHGNERDTAIITIFLNTGIRVQEFVDLRWLDLNISDKKGLMMIRHSKANKYREVPLNKDARYAFIKLGYLEFTGQSEYVLQGQRSRMTVRGIQMMIKRRTACTEMDFISPHTLRHTFCKNLVNIGIGLEQVALLAGHESLETTKIYCQPSLSDLEKSVERIGEME